MQIMSMLIPGVQPTQEIIPYEIEADGDVEYRRYTDGKVCKDWRTGVYTEEPVFIFRKTVDGSITRFEKAWDLWANRKSAKYIPINSKFTNGSIA